MRRFAVALTALLFLSLLLGSAPSASLAGLPIDPSSPNGRIVFIDLVPPPDPDGPPTLCGSTDLFTMENDGTDVRRVTFTSDMADYDTSWSPDGRQIAYITADDRATERCGRKIYTVDADGTNPELASSLDQWQYNHADWTRYGDCCVYSKTELSDKEYSLGGWGSDGYISESWPSTDPTDHSFAFVRSSKDEEGYWKPYQLYVQNRKRESVRIDNGSMSADQPNWSPDGDRIVFVRRGEYSSDPVRIYSIRPDGSDEVFLTEGEHPSWSPDGRFIVFERDHEVWIMARDGSDQRYVHDGWAPDWQPVCSVVGTVLPDVLEGTDGIDVICPGVGDDTVLGSAGNDLVLGGLGDDRLQGGTGADVLIGGPGSDVMSGGAGPDETLSRDGNATNDRNKGGPGFDICRLDYNYERYREDAASGCEYTF